MSQNYKKHGTGSERNDAPYGPAYVVPKEEEKIMPKNKGSANEK
jgi:hypothetical protein